MKHFASRSGNAASSATRLLLRQLQQRRPAAEHGIVRRGRLQAATGDGARQEWPHEERHAQDRRIGEQVEQERLDRLRPVGTAQVEQDDRDPRPARTSSTSSATCSGGVCGTMPWPRLKIARAPVHRRQDRRVSRAATPRRRRPGPSDRGCPATPRRAAPTDAASVEVHRGIQADGIDPVVAAHNRRPCSPARRGKPMTGTVGKRCLQRRDDGRASAGSHGGGTAAGDSTPAQLSNSMTASAPASICAAR